MEPASSIIEKLGGHAKVRKIAGCSIQTTYNWTYPRAGGGTGGLIPQKHHRKLYDYARANGIDLRPEDFMPLPPKKRRAA